MDHSIYTICLVSVKKSPITFFFQIVGVARVWLKIKNRELEKRNLELSRKFKLKK